MAQISDGESGASVRAKLNADLAGAIDITTSLNAAALKTLQSSPAVVVPAQGVNTVIIILHMQIIYRFGTVPFGNPVSLCKVCFDGNLALSVNSLNVSSGKLFEQSESYILADSTAGTSYALALIENKPLSIVTDADYTTGDGLADVVITYRIMSTV